MPNIDNDTKEMLQQFVSEAFDSLDTNEPIVENLREEDNAEFVNAIFRVFHTLKGLSGFFEMDIINKVTHEAETLLDIMRKQNEVQSEDIISVVYLAFDFLRDLLNRVSTEFTDESGADEADDIIVVIKDTITKVQGFAELNDDDNEIDLESEEETDEVSDDEEDEFDPEESFLLDDEEDVSSPEDDSDISDLVSDEMLLQFLTDANNMIEIIENNIIILEQESDNIDIIRKTFGEVHSLKGNAGFMGLSEIENIAGEMETIFDSLRNKEIEINEVIVSILLNNTEIISNRLNTLSQKMQEKSTKKDNKQSKQEVKKADAPQKKEVQEPKEKKKTSEKVDNTPKQTNNKSTKPAQKFAPIQKKDIRVETTKIDRLFDLVGELITIESMVTNNPEIKKLNIPSFNKSAGMLNKITRELQEVTMSVRMMPLDGLFNKMKRLVRDVTIKMGKKVNFEVSGQDTEMDKNVIDEISDPLVHILRNAIDHGIESPEDRIEAGKDEEGFVKLSARYEGNEILIEVEDNGAGIDRNIILNKAIEKGLVNEEDTEKMSDNDVFNLLFEPGFSTAKQLTDISGRGVGMDVVKKNIEKLRGSIDVDSKLGLGSVFTLRIPLTLAIIEAMIIRIGSSHYALPILSVTESFNVDMDNVSQTMDGLEVVKVRDEIMPILRLYELFDDDTNKKELDQGILIIIETRNKKVCLFADEIVGQQQAVVKSLTGYIGKVPGIMGCLVMGDGGIGLIIDVESLISMAQVTNLELLQTNN